jgi:hypothetical protein
MYIQDTRIKLINSLPQRSEEITSEDFVNGKLTQKMFRSSTRRILSSTYSSNSIKTISRSNIARSFSKSSINHEQPSFSNSVDESKYMRSFGVSAHSKGTYATTITSDKNANATIALDEGNKGICHQ